jgi:hypothetical protein
MASILRVNTLTDASSGNSTAMSTINQGTEKSWVNLNGTGTIATRDSFNVASLTDNGTGDYTQTFTNAMGNANYCWLLTTDYQAGTARNANIAGDSSAQATGSIRLHSYGLSAGIADDFEVINCGILGDLA